LNGIAIFFLSLGEIYEFVFMVPFQSSKNSFVNDIGSYSEVHFLAFLICPFKVLGILLEFYRPYLYFLFADALNTFSDLILRSVYNTSSLINKNHWCCLSLDCFL